MDGLLSQLLAFPPHPPPKIPLTDTAYDKGMKELIQTLNKTPASKLTLGVRGGGDLLEIIDPSINSLPYLFVLLSHVGAPGGKQKNANAADGFTPGTPLWLKMLAFMESFDPVQTRYAGNEFRRLFEITAGRAAFTERPNDQSTAISALGSAILRIDPSGSTFTSSHLLFVHLCLLMRAYPESLPVLDHNIYHFTSNTNRAAENNLYPHLSSNHENSSTFIIPESGLSSKLDYRSHLLFFLYGAMCYMGLKEWKRALLFLEIVIMSPISQNASRIQVEAYKKYILVGILYKGSLLDMPKKTNPQAAKQFKAMAKAYEGLAEVFQHKLREAGSVKRLVDEVKAGQPIWGQDCNFGLVRQVIDAYRQYSIRALEKTYAALTIAEITRRTSADADDFAGTGDYVINLISSNKLNATISQPSEDPATWIVRFYDPASGPLARSEEQQYEALAKQTRKVKVLADHIREVDRKLSLSKEYIQDAKKRKSHDDNGGGDDGYPFGHDTGFIGADEDVMGD